jgi:VWFA-related protein
MQKIIALMILAVQMVAAQTTIKVTTRMVEVNVIVRDKNGPVSGLTRDDFTILENGKKRDVEFFSVHSTAAAPAGSVADIPKTGGMVTNRPSQAISQPNVVIVLLDGLNTGIRDQALAKDQFLQFLYQIRPGDRIAVYALGTKLRVLQDFTGDQQRLVRALSRYRGEQSGHVQATNPPIANTGDEDFDSWVNALFAVVSDFYLKDRVERTAAAMEAIASHVARVPGRKSLIWLSAGFPFTIGVERPIFAVSSNVSKADPTTERGTFADQVRRATRALSNANLAVYPVDPRGLTGTAPDYDSLAIQNPNTKGTRFRAYSQVNNDPSSTVPTGQETMRILAEETGGQALYATNDIRNAIHLAAHDAELTYTLGFYPDGSKLDSKFHSIKVEVSRKNVELRHRRGYLAEPEGAFNAEERLAQISNALASPLEASDISISAQYERGPGTLAITVKIDSADIRMRRQGDTWNDTLDLAFAAQDAKGNGIGTINEEAKLSLGAENYQLMIKDGLKFTKKIEAGSDTAAVRILVFDRNSGRFGTLTLTLNVREPRTGPLSAWRPQRVPHGGS